MAALIFGKDCFLWGCSDTGRNLVAERKAYWEKTVRAEIPAGASEAVLTSWARGRSLVVDSPSVSTRLIGLEYVPVSSPICKGFGISLDVTIANDGTISNEVVKSLGNCL